VYRTYVGEDQQAVSAGEREHIMRAVAQAKRRTPLTSPLIYDWIQDMLTLRFPPWAEEADRREWLEFAMRFQQITSPVTARGYEDTALYRFNRLVSLNEVGADPSRFGTPLAEFSGHGRARTSPTICRRPRLTTQARWDARGSTSVWFQCWCRRRLWQRSTEAPHGGDAHRRPARTRNT
jgi:maltooligosyltrehalose synthase